MSIEYQLKFADGVKLSALAGWLRAAGFEDTNASATLLAPGLSATIGDTRDPAGRWKLRGFVLHVQVFFGQDKFALTRRRMRGWWEQSRCCCARSRQMPCWRATTRSCSRFGCKARAAYVLSPVIKWHGSSWKRSGLVCHSFQMN